MSDVASLSVALHLNSAAFRSQITEAYQNAGQASKKFNKQATEQANELANAIKKTVEAAQKIGVQGANDDLFSGATKGAGQLNFVLHEVAAGSNVASSSIINALIPAVHSLKGQLDGSAGGWKAQQEAARNAAAELAAAAKSQIEAAQAERQAALNKVAIAEKTIAAAQAQREQAIALDEYYAKQTEINKLHGLNVNYQNEHLKNERAIIEANRLEASGLDKLKAAKAAVATADAAETGGKAALTAATEAAAAANTELSLRQRIATTSSRALSSAMSLLGGPVGIGLSVLAAGGTLIYTEFKKAEEQTKKLNAAALDLKTSSLVTAADLQKLSGELGNTETSVNAVSAAAKAGFSGRLLNDVATLANAYEKAGGDAQELVNHLSGLRSDPVSAMEKLTASGVVLKDSLVQQVIALKERGSTAQASQLLIEAAIQAEKNRLAELGVDVDKTAETVKNLGNTWGTAGEQAVIALGGAIDKTQNVQRTLRSMAGQLAADIAGATAAAQNERIKNTAGLKSYMDAGTTAAEKRAAAIKRLNNSIYASGSKEYQRILKGINDEYDKATKKDKPKKSGSGETEGQRLLKQAQERNAVLKEQAQTTDKLTESEVQLSVFNEKVSALKGEHLTKSQQSLVNMQDQIRAQLQSNIQLEKEAALRKTALKYQAESRKWEEEAQAMQREAALNLEKYSLSDQEASDTEARNAIINRFNQRRLALEHDFTDKTTTEYQTRLADLESAKQRELAIVEQSGQDRLAAEQDYSAGFRRGAKNWIDNARDANSQIASFTTGAFDDMAGSLASFVITGKSSFKSFTASVLSDLAKIATQIALSSALQSIFGAVGSAIGGGADGGSTPSGAYDTAAANIKFNAKGGVYDSPSLSAYSNQVYDSPQFFAFAKGAGVFGEAGPEAIMPLTRAGDGSLGVRAVGGGQNAGASEGPKVYITIEGGNTSTQAPSGFEQFGQQIGSFVEKKYRELMAQDIRPGGMVWNAVKGQR
ncbi:TPA: phage tail tape measure protein [Klebsiella variicola]|uniref:phage tail tape measure protein n=1 Tax=Klebsiella pneumoniae TaxID=573 RepID=UPI002051E251|nr:phage tail tape measure protein [Klebsiella pneumoniae]EKK1839080.1 phage tail tape measure protein [Klebsiella variicola]DAL05661.1 MAG TPA: tail tape measure protein [Caudoviricetes sp.]MDT9887922.1 phage tail tape measure protein [Klebsiella pneumoniae]MDT9898746.1 phage tail tape measure protein [Klebsiella pneumoniae]MDT9920194.1 phage tail tape measure protein [Klebsiella pneumoniae]